MISILFLSFSLGFFYLGNKALNISTKFKKQTDPPSDFGDRESAKLLSISLILMLVGCFLFFTFAKSILQMLLF